MSIRQISVFLENKPGRLAEVARALAAAGVGVYSVSVADTANFGILRMIVSDARLAQDTLKARGLTAKITEVVAMEMSRGPGSLAEILTDLEAMDISIEYMYAFTSRAKDYDAIVVFRFAGQEEALAKIKRERPGSIKLLGEEVIRGLEG